MNAGKLFLGKAIRPEIPWIAARKAAHDCNVFLCCGTSARVQPAASLADTAIDSGETTVQVNPNPTDLDASVTFTIRGPSGTVLPQLAGRKPRDGRSRYCLRCVVIRSTAAFTSPPAFSICALNSVQAL